MGTVRTLPLPHRASADVLTSTLVSRSESKRCSDGACARRAFPPPFAPPDLVFTGRGGVWGSLAVSSKVWKPLWKPPKGTGDPRPPCASRESNPESNKEESTAVPFRSSASVCAGTGEDMRASTSTLKRSRWVRDGGVRASALSVKTAAAAASSSSSARRESSEPRSCASQSSSSSMSSTPAMMLRKPPLLALPRVPPVDLRVSLERSTGGGVHPTPSAPGVGPNGAVVGAPNGVMGSSPSSPPFITPGDIETSPPPKPGVVSTLRLSAGSMSTETGEVISVPAPPPGFGMGVTPNIPPPWWGTGDGDAPVCALNPDSSNAAPADLERT